jgi:hypothetical protein
VGFLDVYDHGMFGGEKRRKRLQQIRDALQQGLNLGDLVGPQNPAGGQQYGPGQMAQYGPGQMGQFDSIIESVIERQIAKNPALAGNPAIAARMNELIQAAKQDPQGFQQRMQQLAESGVTPESVTPDQIAQLIGPAPGALPGSPGTLPGSPLPPSPPQGNPFGGQQGGGWSPPGAPDQFTPPPAGPFGQPGGQSGGGWSPPGVPHEFTTPPAGNLTGLTGQQPPPPPAPGAAPPDDPDQLDE